MTFAVNDRIISKRRPHEGVASVTAVNEERRILYYSLPNGENPPITGHGPFDAFEHALSLG